ncbi:hypothetical protein NQ314_016278 [Rhamnusium bicolor]|uniref:PH domain-containing protein n=1 Tax=Rhamnusium bicolor TaxID=1586634 RepID=A0AAV8WWM4_9CUCU|nr:hypothetical protein NQ314_016278 [Rhamnusium bicolor]
METDIKKMYLNLNELLEDICKFLSSEKLGTLSPKDKKLADSLINRSKVQLQEISKIQQLSSNEAYVDMGNKKVLVIEEEEGKNNIYSSVDDNNADTETTLIEEGTVYPYKDLSAKDASQEVKWGYISMKRKFLLGFEKMKRIYATIHNQWLIIYFSDKDVKPICTFDLKNYEAKEADSDRSTNFELMCTSPDRKIYYFMALTRKDMLQWVAHINRCHDTVVLMSKGIHLRERRESTNEDDEFGEHYDSINPQSNMEDDEDIYLELDDIYVDSFSEEDDEDSTYESFIDINRFQNKNQDLQQIETNINISNGNSNPQEVPKISVLPVKPKVKDKPAVAKKPTYLRLSSNNS